MESVRPRVGPSVALSAFPCSPIKHEHLNLPLLPSPCSPSMDIGTLSTNPMATDFNFASLPQIKLDPYGPPGPATPAIAVPALYPSLPIVNQSPTSSTMSTSSECGRKGPRNKHQCMSFVSTLCPLDLNPNPLNVLHIDYIVVSRCSRCFRSFPRMPL